MLSVVARSVGRLGRSWEDAVEILTVVVPLRRPHKHFCNIAGCRPTGSLKQIQRDAHVVGVCRGQDFERECIGEGLSAAYPALALGSVRRFENRCRGARWICWIRLLP